MHTADIYIYITLKAGREGFMYVPHFHNCRDHLLKLRSTHIADQTPVTSAAQFVMSTFPLIWQRYT